MRIQSSNVALSSAHSYVEQTTRKESYQFWVGDRRPAAGAEDGSNPGEIAPPVDNHGRHDPDASAPPATTKTHRKNPAGILDEEQLDAMDRMVKDLVEKLFGVRIKIAKIMDSLNGNDTPAPEDLPSAPPSDEASADQPQRQGWGMEYQLQESYTEMEKTDFSAKGVVRTADGKEIKFNLNMSMERAFTQDSQVSIKAGDALIDPLTINFNGTAAQLTDQRYAFDLNSDGKDENIPFVKSGSAFLALDKNGDGKISSGRELFGPSSGNGFNELAQYDSDKNGWIDENDSVYGNLRLMSVDSQGKQTLNTLAEKNVGAIYLGSASTPFTVKNDEQETQGQVASTGIYLNEQGGVGTVQQVNLVA